MEHIDSIKLGIENKISHHEIVRKVYLTYPTKVLVGNEERQYSILNEISVYFDIPIMSIQVIGSAKIGLSLTKGTAFNCKKSDLDIAIIDHNLFRIYSEKIFLETSGFNNRTSFSKGGGKSSFESYKHYLSKGIFRPDLMPSGKTRMDWNSFFGNITNKNRDLFKSVNAGIYFSQHFFEEKQVSAIKMYFANEAL